MSEEIRFYPDGRKVRLKCEPTNIRLLSNQEMADVFLALHRQLTNAPVRSPEPKVYFHREICEEAVRLRIMERLDDGSYLYNGYQVIHPEEFNGGATDVNAEI